MEYRTINEIIYLVKTNIQVKIQLIWKGAASLKIADKLSSFQSWRLFILMYLGPLLLSFFCFTSLALSWSGITVHGKPKYREGFSQLSYASKNARKGGTLKIGWTGSFDTLNPFSSKGLSALLLESLVFQSLGQRTLDEPFSQYPAIAQKFILSKDKLSLKIFFRKDAFSDGKKITAEDVIFSFNIFQSNNVDPFYKSYWQDIKSVKKLNKHTIMSNLKRILNYQLSLLN